MNPPLKIELFTRTAHKFRSIHTMKTSTSMLFGRTTPILSPITAMAERLATALRLTTKESSFTTPQWHLNLSPNLTSSKRVIVLLAGRLARLAMLTNQPWLKISLVTATSRLTLLAQRLMADYTSLKTPTTHSTLPQTQPTFNFMWFGENIPTP